MKQKVNLYAEERQEKILDIIEEKGRVTVPELVEMFGVSGTTIRNDLREMEQENRLLRTHGGAISSGKRSDEEVVDLRENVESKISIAKRAVDYVEAGDSLIIDTGSTCIAFAQILAMKNIPNLKIITADLRVATILETMTSGELIMIGGTIRREFHNTYGAHAISELAGYAVDKAFMGSNAFTINGGFSTPNLEIAELKEATIRAARQVFILCDASKFGKDSFRRFAGIDNVDLIITDSTLSDNKKAIFEKASIAYVIA